MRNAVAISIILISAVGLFFALGWLGMLPRSRVIVVPDGFTGEVVIAYHPTIGKSFNGRPFNFGTTRIIIPEDGNLIISDWDEFGGMSSEKYIRQDGTILGGTHPWAGTSKIKTKGTMGRNPGDDEPFLKSAMLDDDSVMYSGFTVLK
ncbi:MAG: hypothetical protein CMO55_00250 [Verrucomicrobiales bacterium]|nr:hypothetical protein [Verrucomicrobiales bacterium]